MLVTAKSYFSGAGHVGVIKIVSIEEEKECSK